MLESIASRLRPDRQPAIPLRALLPALGLLSLAACGGSTGTSPDPATPPGVSGSPVRITLSLGKVGLLSKTSAIDLRKLVLTAVSQGAPADTVRDTSRFEGSGSLTVGRVVELKPLVAWVVSARTLDQRDSVIHAGATAPFTVTPADTAEVVLALASRFLMYQARFSDLPDSLAAGTPDPVGIALDRLVLRLDGEVKADSTLPAGQSFSGGRNVTLQFDYVTPGSHAVVLEAYGTLDAWSGLMFSGAANLESAAGKDGTQPVTLRWVGPATGGAAVSLILGHIGKVTLVGGFNPML